MRRACRMRPRRSPSRRPSSSRAPPCRSTASAFKAYAINSQGTSYTSAGNFTTLAKVLDIDGNQGFDALTDGMIILRYLSGETGAALTAGATGPGATRIDPTLVQTYLDLIHPQLDVDGDGQINAATDGLLIMRWLAGL